MDKSNYTYSQLEKKHFGFAAPDFEITIDDTKIDRKIIGIPGIKVDITSEYEAGGCSFSVINAFDPVKSQFNSEWLNKYFKPGSIVKVEMGYIEKTVVFLGFINTMGVSFMQGDAPKIDISCIEAKGYLMNGLQQENMGNKKLKDIVTETLKQCQSAKLVSKVTVEDLEDVEWEVVQNCESDYSFLESIAKKYNYMFCVIGDEILFSKPRKIGDAIIKLEWGKNLMSFEREVDITNQVCEVVVVGVEPDTNKPIIGKANTVTVSGDGSKTAEELAKHIKKRLHIIRDSKVHTNKEAETIAKAEKDAISMELVTGTGSCIGIPQIIPGRFIELSGMGPGIDNKYYITKVTQNFTNSGYTTNFTVRNNAI